MLGLTKGTQARSTEKLSSGYKINRAADDAAGLSISEKMRKQIRGLTQASTNAQDGISAVQTAEGALNEVQDMLQRMNELAVKAANGTNSEDDRSYIQDEIDQLVTEIDRVSETTKFNETYLLKGDKSGEKAVNFKYNKVQVTKADAYYMDNGEVKTVKAGSFYDALDSNIAYYKSDAGAIVGESADSTCIKSIVANKAEGIYKFEDNKYTLVNVGDEIASTGTYYSGSFDASKNFQTVGSVAGSAISQDGFQTSVDLYDSTGASIKAGYSLGSSSANISAYVQSDTHVAKLMGDTYANTEFAGNTDKVQLLDKDGNEIASNGLYRYLEADENGVVSIKTGAEVYLSDGSTVPNADQLKAMVDGSSKFSIGSLKLTLHVGADATTNNQISVDLQTMSAEQLGVKDLKVDGKDDKNALDAIETIKEALQRVSTQRSALGAVQNRLEHTIANLDNVVENTTSAESTIRDTDMATEMVKYSNNNILAQAGQAMLAQANQSNQGVLSLLG
jgi:flagellin